jgi:hypothetical protein
MVMDTCTGRGPAVLQNIPPDAIAGDDERSAATAIKMRFAMRPEWHAA